MIRRRLLARASLVLAAVVACGLLVSVGPATGVTGPSVTVADITAVEGDAGIATVRVSVDLSAPSAEAIKIPYVIAASRDGFTDGSDLKLTHGSLGFAAGATTRTIGVQTIGDTVVEQDQHATITLGAPVGGGATIGDGIGVVTLLDDDANGVSPGIEVSVGDVVLTEADAGLHNGYLPITLSRPAEVITKVGFQMDCESAALISDLTMRRSGTVTFQIGQREKNLSFSVSADLTPDQLHDIVERITSQTASVKVLDQRGDATINDDDGSLPSNPGHAVPGFATEALPGPSSFDQQAPGDINQVTLTPSGAEPSYVYSDPGTGNYGSAPAFFSMSADGRYTAFTSEQVDLVPGDTNGAPDVFVRDRVTGATERVSVNPDGSQIVASEVPTGFPAYWGGGNGGMVSSDGRYVVFNTNASLVPGDVWEGQSWVDWGDAYVFDRLTHSVAPVTVDSAGGFIHGAAEGISAHGRYVMFAKNGKLYTRDIVAGTTTMIYDAAMSGPAVMSANGRYVVTPSKGVSCFDQELALIDVQDGSTERIDVTDNGEGASQENQFAVIMYAPAISGDGRYVAFKSGAWNMIPGLTEAPIYTSGAFDQTLVHPYVRDRQLLSTSMLGLGADGVVPPYTPFDAATAVSDDGSLVGVSTGYNSGEGHLYDRASGVQQLIGFPYSYDHLATRFGPTAMSADGRYLAFSSSHYVIYGKISLGDGYVQRLR